MLNRVGRKVKLPSTIDPECIPLCRAINEVWGLETWMSCSGHQDGRDFWIHVDYSRDGPFARLLWILECRPDLMAYVRIMYESKNSHFISLRMSGKTLEIRKKKADELAEIIKNNLDWMEIGEGIPDIPGSLFVQVLPEEESRFELKGSSL